MRKSTSGKNSKVLPASKLIKLIASNVKQARLSRGMTQLELAKRIKADQAAVSRLEHGKFVHLNVKHLTAIAKTLRTTPIQLLQ